MPNWGGAWGTEWGCTTEFVLGGPLTDVCDDWLWWQYQRAPNMQGLCRIFAEVFGKVDTSLNVVIANRGVGLARGGELDSWATALGVRRNGASDDLLLRKIQARARSSFGEGQSRDWFDVMTLIAPNSDPIFTEVFPACVRVIFKAVSEAEQDAIFELMQEVPALGICFSYVQIDPSGIVFEFSYLESDPADPRVYFPITHHWDFFPDRDMPPDQTAGFAYLIE